MNTYTYAPPTPHSYDTLDRLERELVSRHAEWKQRTAALAAIWDRIDAGEQNVSDDAERADATVARDAVDDARAAFVAEWKRVGSPLDRALDVHGERLRRR